MKKKKGGGGGANWMDTYGDMVTLLLCFFVLLYSMSTISEEAWKNLVMSFNPYAVMSGESQGGGGPSADGAEQGVMPEPTSKPNDQEEIDEKIDNLFLALSALAGANDSVDASSDGGRVFLSFDGTAFFKGNSDALTAEALPVLEEVARELSESAYAIDEICVIGHTAQYATDRPNDAWEDWRLSSTRAARVVAYIQNLTNADVLDPAKLVTEGRGQWQPRSDNDTEDGRAKNRRVEMIISGRNLEEEMSEGIPSYSTTPSYSTAAADESGAADGAKTPVEPDVSGAPAASSAPE